METQYRVSVWTAENVLAQNAKVVRRKPVAAEDPLRIRVRETQARRLAKWYERHARRYPCGIEFFMRPCWPRTWEI